MPKHGKAFLQVNHRPDQHVPTAPSRDQQRGGAALLVIDMMNAFDFGGADRLKPKAVRAAKAICALRDRFDAADLPVIYVNDNFNEWHSERSKLVKQGLTASPEVLMPIAPREADYFVIKPQFSGFYATNLPLLLPKLGVSNLVLTGIQTDICVLFTAADAHMRDYGLWVPCDCVASVDDESGRQALAIASQSMAAETRSQADLPLDEWLESLRGGVKEAR